jgi:HSP20 family protein
MRLMRRNNPWDPFREMEAFSSQFNRLFGPSTLLGGERELLASTDWSPSCDISETDDSFRIEAELPGVKKDDVKVDLESGVLRISGERKEEKEIKNEKVHRRELFRGTFARSFTMPENADQERVEANFKDGILKVNIAKTKNAKHPQRQISVK